MKHLQLFNAIKNEFNEEIALTTMLIQAISLTVKVKRKHLTGKKSFIVDIEEKAHAILWETDPTIFDKSFKIFMVLDDYTSRIELEGLGGCVKKSFNELLGNSHD